MEKEMMHQLFATGQGQAVLCLPACEEKGNFASTGKH